MHQTINVTHLTFLGDRWITKLFFSVNWWRPQCWHSQEVQDLLPKVSSSSLHRLMYCPKTPDRKRNGSVTNLLRGPGWVCHCSAVTETASLRLAVPIETSLTFVTALSDLVPSTDFRRVLCTDSWDKSPRLDLGIDVRSHLGPLGRLEESWASPPRRLSAFV